MQNSQRVSLQFSQLLQSVSNDYQDQFEQLGMIQVLNNKYQLYDLLGQGELGQVYKAKINSQKEENKFVAIKFISKQIDQIPGLREKYLDQEFKLLNKNISKHCVQLIDYGEDRSYYLLVYNYCNQGNLSDLIQSEKKKKKKNEHGFILQIDLIKKYLYQICIALQDLHKAGYIHRNLKPENILLHDYEIVLSDLCFARDINQLTKSSIGTFASAPEQMEESEQNESVDVWGIGIALFYMLFGELPFQCNPFEIYNHIKVNTTPYFSLRKFIKDIFKMQELSKEINEQLENLFQQIFTFDSKKRISIQSILQDQFLVNVVKQQQSQQQQQQQQKQNQLQKQDKQELNQNGQNLNQLQQTQQQNYNQIKLQQPSDQIQNQQQQNQQQQIKQQQQQNKKIEQQIQQNENLQMNTFDQQSPLKNQRMNLQQQSKQQQQSNQQYNNQQQQNLDSAVKQKPQQQQFTFQPEELSQQKQLKNNEFYLNPFKFSYDYKNIDKKLLSIFQFLKEKIYKLTFCGDLCFEIAIEAIQYKTFKYTTLQYYLARIVVIEIQQFFENCDNNIYNIDSIQFSQLKKTNLYQQFLQNINMYKLMHEEIRKKSYNKYLQSINQDNNIPQKDNFNLIKNNYRSQCWIGFANCKRAIDEWEKKNKYSESLKIAKVALKLIIAIKINNIFEMTVVSFEKFYQHLGIKIPNEYNFKGQKFDDWINNSLNDTEQIFEIINKIVYIHFNGQGYQDIINQIQLI